MPLPAAAPPGVFPLPSEWEGLLGGAGRLESPLLLETKPRQDKCSSPEHPKGSAELASIRFWQLWAVESYNLRACTRSAQFSLAAYLRIQNGFLYCVGNYLRFLISSYDGLFGVWPNIYCCSSFIFWGHLETVARQKELRFYFTALSFGAARIGVQWKQKGEKDVLSEINCYCTDSLIMKPPCLLSSASRYIFSL